MMAEPITPPPPGSHISGLILDRQRPGIAAEVERITSLPDLPDEAVAIITKWHQTAGGWRYLLAAEQAGEQEIAFIDDPDELKLEVLKNLARAQSSRWGIYAAPDAEAWLTALLLECSEPGGTA